MPNFRNGLRLDDVHTGQMEEAMGVMDSEFALPLLWGSVKLSSWYAVGLFMRQRDGDIETACKLLRNGLTQQNLDPTFDRNYGSFKEFMSQPDASGPDALWAPKIYDSYDPNNALFFTLACIVILSEFSGLVDPELKGKLQEAILQCCKGNALREGDRYGDDMWPSYSNPWFMRCVCCAFVGDLVNDQELIQKSDAWTTEATTLWEANDAPGEFNSPTYAGITLLALGLAKYCPPTSAIARNAPKLLESLWRSLGQTYNPTLHNIAGPWDRSYGFCMTRYYACAATAIAAVDGHSQRGCYPKPIAGSSHYDDIAVVPLQIIVSDYVESHLPYAVRQNFYTLTPHAYTASSFFPPHDRRPRRYTFWLEDGLSVGGVEYDHERLGGPKGEQKQFVPGVIQWDSGQHGGGCGWIKVWPSASSAKLVATSDSLTVSYPPSRDYPKTAITSNEIELHISALPFLQLDSRAFENASQELPGLAIHLDGNVVDHGTRLIEFSQETQCWGQWYYKLKYMFPESLRQNGLVPELQIRWQKTQPPVYPFEM